ncbi:MAG: pentapeptide repeat-containing protein [Treponema sp.]
MYLMNICSAKDCNNTALSSFDENGNITEDKGFCFEHLANKDEYVSKIKKYILDHDKIVGLTACGISFSDSDFTNKKFYGCNFQHCTFSNIHADNTRMRMCIFDFSSFENCSFLKSNIQYTSFSGSNFSQTLFTGSDLIDNNFNGATAVECSFDDSDCYNSRFIRANLQNTSFRNCNIKKTIFYNSTRDNVSLKLSNTREALFDRNTAGLVSEIDTITDEDLTK